MQTHPALGAFRGRLAPALIVLALLALALPAGALAKKSASPVLTFKVMEVGAPGNPAAGIVPFTNAIYRSCEEAPAPKNPKRGAKCMTVGSVGYDYGIGKLEVTVAQWVAFLNTADPLGRNRRDLYSENESGAAWPRFGQINFNAGASTGHHYSLAAPEWADKPYGFANFLRAARFANSLYNGKLLTKSSGTEGPYSFTQYRVRLSPRTERGMYDMRNPKTTRTKKKGFVIPSQDEWIKAAYYDPTGKGTYSYWQYPTNPGLFGSEEQAPKEATLDPTTGDVTNASSQPLAIYHNPKATTPAPSWCPSNQTAEACAVDNPLGLPAEGYENGYTSSLGTVGQAGTLSPWGTLDQGGNAVEWTDTITAPPFGVKGKRVWRRLHGGISNAPAYQLWLSAVGLQPQNNTFFTATYPWLGLRIGVVGDLKLGKH
jgi:formylglycine-generating enzyme required for sulfatase activity